MSFLSRDVDDVDLILKSSSTLLKTLCVYYNCHVPESAESSE